MTRWQREQFQALVRKVCETGNISPADFDRVVTLSGHANPNERREIDGLIRLMSEELRPPRQASRPDA